MENTLTSKRDELNNQIAAAPVGQDVSALLAARNWYNRAIYAAIEAAQGRAQLLDESAEFEMMRKCGEV